MIRFVDECVCCDLPCVNCGLRNVERLYCDECEHEIEDEYYDLDGEDVCPDCLSSLLIEEYLKSRSVRHGYYTFALNLDDSFTKEEIEKLTKEFDKKDDEAQIKELYNEELDIIAEFLGFKLTTKRA